MSHPSFTGILHMSHPSFTCHVTHTCVCHCILQASHTSFLCHVTHTCVYHCILEASHASLTSHVTDTCVSLHPSCVTCTLHTSHDSYMRGSHESYMRDINKPCTLPTQHTHSCVFTQSFEGMMPELMSRHASLS